MSAERDVLTPTQEIVVGAIVTTVVEEVLEFACPLRRPTKTSTPGGGDLGRPSANDGRRHEGADGRARVGVQRPGVHELRVGDAGPGLLPDGSLSDRFAAADRFDLMPGVCLCGETEGEEWAQPVDPFAARRWWRPRR